MSLPWNHRIEQKTSESIAWGCDLLYISDPWSIFFLFLWQDTWDNQLPSGKVPLMVLEFSPWSLGPIAWDLWKHSTSWWEYVEEGGGLFSAWWPASESRDKGNDWCSSIPLILLLIQFSFSKSHLPGSHHIPVCHRLATKLLTQGSLGAIENLNTSIQPLTPQRFCSFHNAKCT